MVIFMLSFLLCTYLPRAVMTVPGILMSIAAALLISEAGCKERRKE